MEWVIQWMGEHDSCRPILREYRKRGCREITSRLLVAILLLSPFHPPKMEEGRGPFLYTLTCYYLNIHQTPQERNVRVREILCKTEQSGIEHCGAKYVKRVSYVYYGA